MNELIVEFLDRIGLTDVTLAESDCGRAQTVAARHPEGLARLLLISCEAFGNRPRGLPGEPITPGCRVPGGVELLVRVLGGVLRARWRRHVTARQLGTCARG
ncbi:hypothetical protein [Streptomyces sp. NPDC051636]|uniref:hypothetical protein n=1 Tax=Streptomyces sp. NPDC051636 TaxID=3365663 RepID=UPI00379FE34C